MSSGRILEITRSIPLSFYSVQFIVENFPQNIAITLRGARAAFKKLDWLSLKASINVDTLTDPYLPFTLKQEHVCLPNTIKLINSNPSPLSFTINKDKRD